MISLIEACFSRARVVVLLFAMVLAFGVLAYGSIPKESAPEIPIPMAHVSTTLEGISPADARTMLVQPLESELGQITGLKSMTATAQEGVATVMLEFAPGYDVDTALDAVREAAGRAEPDLPADATAPVIQEINTALFPIMTVIAAGDLGEAELALAGERLADAIEAIDGVLEVDLAGTRDATVEVIVDPLALQSYRLSFTELASAVASNNRLIAAGAMEAGEGRLSMKLDGLIGNVEDLVSMPIRTDGLDVLRLGDVARVMPGYKDVESITHLDGRPAVSLEVKKKAGANIIETADAVRAVIEASRTEWPVGFEVSVIQDESGQVRDLLGDLQSNVMASVVLVMIIILFFLGPRSAFLVSLSIPGAFLSGIAVLWICGWTMNMIVLFGLILVAGMLVDGAIVVIEYAERRMAEGARGPVAFRDAATRMAWPIVSSTATTLSVFLPLLFWQGMIGEFMKFLPLTVLFTLAASLVMALVFVPVLGAVVSPRKRRSVRKDAETPTAAEMTYGRLLERAVSGPKTALALVLLAITTIVFAYGSFNHGVEFFPGTEPDLAMIDLHSQDNLSPEGKARLMSEVEALLLGHPHLKSVYGRTGSQGDTIASIQIVFTDWDTRPKAKDILADLRQTLRAVEGVDIEISEAQSGPVSGKPVSIELAGGTAEARVALLGDLRGEMVRLGGLTDISDSLPLPGIAFRIDVDRGLVKQHGADIDTIGQAVRMATSGVVVSSYRPTGASEPVDIVARFPVADRRIDRLLDMPVPTSNGPVPMSTFAKLVPTERATALTRIDARDVDTIEANVAPGVLASARIGDLQKFVEAMDAGDVAISFKGEAEDQQAAMIFLASAFLVAIWIMLLILVAQFNSIAQALLVMSAIITSVAGVLLGLMITGRPFGVVMGGLAVISLAGIVVNNNIVLIDTYNERRRAGSLPMRAAIEAGTSRFRPVMLTSITTILGLVPMALAMSIDIPGRTISFGAPSTLWWVDLSSAVAGGLTFSTMLTLLATPAMLVLIDGRAWRRERGLPRRRWLRRRGRSSAQPELAGPMPI